MSRSFSSTISIGFSNKWGGGGAQISVCWWRGVSQLSVCMIGGGGGGGRGCQWILFELCKYTACNTDRGLCILMTQASCSTLTLATSWGETPSPCHHP